MANWAPMRRLLAGRKVMLYDVTGIQAYWRQHLIDIELEGVLGGWYIRVKHPDGCYLYDGWWRDSDDKSLDDAVAEAFRGACLLEVA